VFPTFQSYIDQFKIFIDTIQPGGRLIYSEDDEVLNNVVAESTATIGKLPYTLPEYVIEDGITTIISDGKKYPLQVFGEHNLLNMQAARLACESQGISTADFYSYITTFKGAARRLELVGKNETSSLFKDFAHSPSKLAATIHAVKTQFPQRKLIACIELHTFSSLNKEFLAEYAGTMDEADEALVFIDNKTFEQKKMEPYPPKTVEGAFARSIIFFNQPGELKAYLESVELLNANLLMMSSGNFGGIDLIELKNKIL
jgi:UDP-N-acetylmuramate: L-alanyl-gamma-D-glutamyl-meso-diaminopimelate ligase